MKRIFALCLSAILCFCSVSSLAGTTPADQIVSLVKEKVTEFDPCFGEEQKDRYVYNAEANGENWKVTVSLYNDFSLSMVEFYVLTVNSHGEILDIVVDPLNISLEPAYENQFLALRRLTAERGPWYEWTIEERYQFETDYSHGDYRLPQEGDLSEEKALQMGYDALQAATGKTDAEMDALYAVANLNNEAASWPNQWTVLFYEPGNPRTGFGTAYPNQVQLTNPDGEIVEIFISGEGNG